MSTDTRVALAEIDAMRSVAEALSPLEEDSRARVLRWAMEHYEVEGQVLRPGKKAQIAEDSGATVSQPGGFSDLAELYNATAPTTDADRALVCGYFFQFIQGQPDFTGQAVNDELKNLGHGVGNITVAFYRLQFQKPALVMQVRKDGSTKQARKKYKVTGEGKKAVEAMIAANRGGDE
jgi:hypothetical protein